MSTVLGHSAELLKHVFTVGNCEVVMRGAGNHGLHPRKSCVHTAGRNFASCTETSEQQLPRMLAEADGSPNESFGG